MDGNDLHPERAKGCRPGRVNRSSDGEAPDARRGRSPRDAQDGLSERGLGIDPTLAGQDDVGAGKLCVEMRLLGLLYYAKKDRFRWF